MQRVLLLVIAVGLVATPLSARAANVTIAVMPFRDLAGSRDPVGEAIRESVTSDLRNVPGVRVVERAEISRVINEQKLQGTEIDQDPLATMRLGKLIGADLMTVGAYQKFGRRIRLTARFVKVETGEVVGATKVDGDQAEFLALQDRITVELLKSARLQPQAVERFARRARPKLRSLRPVELFGRAAVEQDAPMKRALLKEAVKAEPQFTYASDELSQLEKRLREYEEKAKAARKAELEAAKKAWAEAPTPAEKWSRVHMYLAALNQQRRFNESIRVMRESLRELEKLGSAAEQDESLVRFSLLHLLRQIGRYDEAMKEGELFLQKHPKSLLFAQVKSFEEDLIARQRRIEQGRTIAPLSAKAIVGEQRWNPCRLATEYDRASQFPEARRLLIACYEAGTDDRAATLQRLVFVSLELGDHEAARHYDALLEQESPELFERNRTAVENRLPIDE